ncbi:hypothetical protein C7999DRAFT_44285 [Corynascus novoguineensis]|uniref:Uncharacterized protein n=1 Tax=Corynascus novoguineensis TaxID=1126955 RepID=A0AAN7CLI4_9PEZI|nr:hypothetical protein C7999DRAFT_44285 [Corynascus novoguineensis]
MERNARRRVRLLLFVSMSLLVENVVAQSTCYNTRGEEDPNQRPCRAPGADTGAATWCCSRGDTCLSNGLCLSPKSNNLMTQQGCTDKNWGGSCKKYCPASNNQRLTEIPLIPCPASFDSATNDIKFCCGPDPSTCCQRSSSSSWITLPSGTIIPSQESDSSSISSSSSTESKSDSRAYSLKIGLGIGLGIGVPILLVLLAVAYLLAQPLHSRRKRGRRGRGGGGGGRDYHKRRGSGGNGATGDDAKTEKTSDTSHTYPPRSYFANHTRTTPRRKSFGNHVDIEGRALPPPPPLPHSDDEGDHHDDNHAAAWPPQIHHVQGARGLATMLAQWARSPFGFGELNPPPPRPQSPREMDGSEGARSGSGSSSGRGGSTPSRLGAAELPSPDLHQLEEGGGGGEGAGAHGFVGVSAGRGVWKVARRVHVAAEEVELPTPDTPQRPERDVERGLGGR